MEIVICSGYKIKKDFVKNVNIRNYIYYDKRKEEQVSTIIPIKEGLILPRNYEKLIRSLKTDNFKLICKKNSGEKINFNLIDFSLRDYQKKDIKKILDKLKNSPENACIYQAPAGSGKTYSSIYLIKQLGIKTLFLVDKTSLVEQTYKEFTQNSNAKVVLLNSKNKFEKGDIYISTLQFLNLNKDVVNRLNKEVGFIIVDECHLVSVGALTKTMLSFDAKYRLGLSATPTRSDGLTEAIYDHFSNLVIGGNPDIKPVKHIIIQHYLPIFYSGKYEAQKAWQRLYNSKLLLDDVVDFVEFLLKKGRSIFLYSTYNENQENLKNLLAKKGIRAEIINQATTGKERKKYLEDFENEKLRVLIGGTILQKGVSIYRMDTIINLATHTKETYEQTIGRLRREHKNKKEPLFFTFCFLEKGERRCRLQKEWSQKLKISHKDIILYVSYQKWINSFKSF